MQGSFHLWLFVSATWYNLYVPWETEKVGILFIQNPERDRSQVSPLLEVKVIAARFIFPETWGVSKEYLAEAAPLRGSAVYQVMPSKQVITQAMSRTSCRTRPRKVIFFYKIPQSLSFVHKCFKISHSSLPGAVLLGGNQNCLRRKNCVWVTKNQLAEEWILNRNNLVAWYILNENI